MQRIQCWSPPPPAPLTDLVPHPMLPGCLAHGAPSGLPGTRDGQGPVRSPSEAEGTPHAQASYGRTEGPEGQGELCGPCRRSGRPPSRVLRRLSPRASQGTGDGHGVWAWRLLFPRGVRGVEEGLPEAAGASVHCERSATRTQDLRARGLLEKIGPMGIPRNLGDALPLHRTETGATRVT